MSEAVRRRIGIGRRHNDSLRGLDDAPAALRPPLRVTSADPGHAVSDVATRAPSWLEPRFPLVNALIHELFRLERPAAWSDFERPARVSRRYGRATRKRRWASALLDSATLGARSSGRGARGGGNAACALLLAQLIGCASLVAGDAGAAARTLAERMRTLAHHGAILRKQIAQRVRVAAQHWARLTAAQLLTELHPDRGHVTDRHLGPHELAPQRSRACLVVLREVVDQGPDTGPSQKLIVHASPRELADGSVGRYSTCNHDAFARIHGAGTNGLVKDEILWAIRRRHVTLSPAFYAQVPRRGIVPGMANRGPHLTVDVILRMPNGKILLVERRHAPFGHALPGGFVEYGETVENAAAREALEETGIEVRELRQFHVYSDPGRDPRRHTVSVVFLAEGAGRPRAGSDAKEVLEVDPREPGVELVFDHAQILRDYVVAGEGWREEKIHTRWIGNWRRALARTR
jgi:8-oxo-dGTP diphosphatase